MYTLRTLVVPDHIHTAAEQVADYFEFIGQPVWRLKRLQSYVALPARDVDIALPIDAANDAVMGEA